MTISPEAFQYLLERSAAFRLLDVRTPAEVADWDLGGRHIPLDQLLSRLDEIADWRDEDYIVICGTGLQSQAAERMLRKRGFLYGRNLEGGLNAVLSL
jgi:rhodanese-related sulfurtransferase